MLADDYDGVLGVAREQVEYGAHALDVCVALTERGDEAEQMTERRQAARDGHRGAADDRHARAPARCARRSRRIPAARSSTPSTWRTAATASRPYVPLGGRARRRGGRADDRRGRHGQDARREAARRARRSTTSAWTSTACAPEDLIFDALTFTLATGDEEWIDSAVETIEGIRLIKRELPGVLTSLGVSNVSFGLSPRARTVAQLGLPAPLRRGRPRHGDGQPDAHHGRTWRSRPRSASSPTTWSTTAGRTRCRG